MALSAREYARHAERFGCEGVLETALEEGFTAIEYLQLVGTMRRVDQQRFEAERAGNPRHYVEPAWKPTRAQIEFLIGVSTEQEPKLVARLLGVTEQTVKRHREAALEAASSLQNVVP